MFEQMKIRDITEQLLHTRSMLPPRDTDKKEKLGPCSHGSQVPAGSWGHCVCVGLRDAQLCVNCYINSSKKTSHGTWIKITECSFIYSMTILLGFYKH